MSEPKDNYTVSILLTDNDKIVYRIASEMDVQIHEGFLSVVVSGSPLKVHAISTAMVAGFKVTEDGPGDAE